MYVALFSGPTSARTGKAPLFASSYTSLRALTYFSALTRDTASEFIKAVSVYSRGSSCLSGTNVACSCLFEVQCAEFGFSPKLPFALSVGVVELAGKFLWILVFPYRLWFIGKTHSLSSADGTHTHTHWDNSLRSFISLSIYQPINPHTYDWFI